MNTLNVRVFCGLVVIASSFVAALGQSQTGAPAFSTSISFGPTTVNLANLDVHVPANLFHKPGRGVPFDYSVAYDSLLVPNNYSMGWTLPGPAGWMEFQGSFSGVCFLDGQTHSYYGFGPYHDANGTVHGTGWQVSANNPCALAPGATGALGDGSGITYIVTSALSIDFQLPNGTIVEPIHGSCAGPPYFCTSVGGGTITDPNGNVIYEELNPNPNQIVDTTGETFAVGGDYWLMNSLAYKDSNGNAQTVKLSYGSPSQNVQTNYGCANHPDFPATLVAWHLVTQISYPDGTNEQFTYEPTPGFPGSTTGRIASVTLPTGGTINFAYPNPNDGINCSDGSMAALTVTTGDGSWSFQRAVGTGGASTTTVTDPQGSQLVITFQKGLETQRQVFQGNSTTGTLLRTRLTCYNGNKTNCATATAPKFPITEVTVFDLLPNGLESEKDTFLNANSELQTEIDEYDFGPPSGGSSQPGALLRKTLTSYAGLGNNITSKPSSVTVCRPSGTDTACNGSGTKVAQTTFNYDEGTLIATSGIPQHASVSGSRGNLTSVHRWVSSTGGTVNTGFTFDDAGQVQTATDANGNPPTSFAYDCNDAYVNKVTLPSTTVSLVTSSTHDCSTGLTLSATDVNGQITSYSYDEIMRPTTVVFPDTGQTTISYPNANQSVVQRTIDSTRSTYSTSLIDGYGRLSRTATANGEPIPYDQQDFCYTSNGELGFKSYPYQGNAPVFGGAKVCSGAGDSFTYDALGRTTQITHSDGSASTISYGGTSGGRATEVTDEGNGSFQVSRILQKDALGRLTSVCELYSGTPLQGNGTPASCGLDIPGTGFLTTYAYDSLDNLISVVGSANPRTYAYDSLSRQLCAAVPEIGGSAACPNPDNGAYTLGTTRYSYDANGNLTSKQAPAPNQNGTGTVTTTYSYDVVNRLTQKSYSDGTTPIANFVYDTAPTWANPAATGTHVIGRLSEIYTQPFTSGAIFGYDSMGRIIMNNQCTPIDCGSGNRPFNYGFDFLGDVTSASNGVGVTLNYSYNIAGRLTGITSSLSDAYHPPTLLSAVTYSPSQVTDTLGNQVIEATSFSPRGMVASYLANAPNGTPGTGSVTVSGNLQTYQQQTQPGTAAGITVSVSGVDATNTVTVTSCGLIFQGRCTRWITNTTHPADSGYLQYSVNANGSIITSSQVSYNGTSTTSALAQSLAGSAPANSYIGAAWDGDNTFKVTATSVGASGNSYTISTVAQSSCVSGTTRTGSGISLVTTTTTCGAQGWSFSTNTGSGTFAGGSNPQFQTAFDNGSTTIKVNNYPDTYSWSGSTTTPASIAQGLCNTINGDTAAFATASTNGIAGQCPLGSTTISLASRNDGQNYTLSASSSSVVNSFSVNCPGFANCITASLAGGGSHAYSFNLVSAPDGQITSANDLVNGNWSFGYDQFNRLLSANKNSGQQTFTYDYDPSGNRWHENAPQGGPAPQYIFDNNNHIIGSGVGYDAAGNVVTDGLGNSFVWDAEGRLIQVKQGGTVAASYSYAADGHRVEGPNGDYLYDIGGHMITQIGLTGVWNFGEIYAGGRHLATYSGGTTNFFQSDWLGTKRVMTALNGTVSETCTGLPFGDGANCTGTDWSYSRFTDDIHDPETNLEHTEFRKYSSTQGRWMTPDPLGTASVSLGNPQSLNRYAYVNNNPLNGTDPLGLLRSIGGTWFGNCTVDGLSNFCGGLGFNDLAPCPDNFCEGFASILGPFGFQPGPFYQFKADAANSYYACDAPGSYDDATTAGIAAETCADPISIIENREYGGKIYKTGDDYSFTLPQHGTSDSVTVVTMQLPDGAEYAGNYHTHGAFDSQYDNEMFSPSQCKPGHLCDIGIALDYGLNQDKPNYLATPSGRIIMFDPNDIGTYPNGCVLVGPAVKNGDPGGSSVDIPKC